MALHLCSHALVGIIIGVHIGIAVASSPSAESLMPGSPMKRLSHFATGNGATSRTLLAFATSQSARCDCIGACSRPPHSFAFLSQRSVPRLPPLEYGASAHDRHDLLTPETYADSRSAEHRVEGIITAAAADAFRATDFAHEPHLSPELADVETCYEIALLANAAHEFADMADKENRQSRAAMLERERESEWIEQYDVEAVMEAEALIEEIEKNREEEL